MPGFLLDLDGTLYNGDQPIPHAAEFIAMLRKRGLPFVFLTNNSSRTPGQVAAHLVRTGIAAHAEEVLTSSQAAALYLQDAGGVRRIMAIGEDGLHQALSEAGFEVTSPEEATANGTAVDAVVQGIDRSFTYAKLHAAVREIRRGARSVLTNPDHLLPWNGELTPGAGSIGAAIERSSEVAPVVIGKPSPIIMRYAVAKLGLAPQEIWAVGDNLGTDIRGGRDAGCRTALVLTGLVNEENAEAWLQRSGVTPELICRDLKELAARLELPF
ncbi:HAD-IIA family hydrolase [Paenibacillus sp. GD4]|uniref:HAD-IIA family hydrolase n=1 Tax=Paenibacillus sp. GD4 TaxID=3068890 RepID=UPI0027968C05|nr:HAD-IIA family hydrolase [Paenibacillus sp. GD4]MDQ1912168.1 HAD-IIA family hydrolase [Paenibacillus sp. GD4]